MLHNARNSSTNLLMNSQSDPPWIGWLPYSVHIDNPHSLWLSRFCCSTKSHRSQRRLLLLRRYRDEHCGYRRIYTREQYVYRLKIHRVASLKSSLAFPMAVFLIYGSHWGSLAYTQDPIHQTTSPFSELGGANGKAYNSSQGFHNVSMWVILISLSAEILTLKRAIASFVFLIGTIRVNLFFTFTFFGLVMLFSFIAAADFSVGSATSEADLEHISKLLHIAGGFGWLGLISGWYLAILTACEAVGIPCPLPVLDLSSKVFPSKQKPVEVN